MFDVTLIKLSEDARTVALEPGRIERRGLADADLRTLLQNFCALDPVENAAADPELRVTSRAGSFLVRAVREKLILYNVLDRESPAQVLTVDETMAELDGSALAARAASRPAPLADEPAVAKETPPARARRRGLRLLVKGLVAAALAAALVLLHLPGPSAAAKSPFRPLPAREAAALRASLVGVYMTGTAPGAHGIVITDSGLRVFELLQTKAPHMVYASARLGRAGSTLCLATDQPGGDILIPDRDTLVYCGETYRRIR